jgi:hypothetical protein
VEVKFLDVSNNLPPKSKEMDGVVGPCAENCGLVSKTLAMREGKDRLCEKILRKRSNVRHLKFKPYELSWRELLA